MRLSELGEFRLIEAIRKATPKGRGVLLGIGDDAAWVKCRNHSTLITSDILIEGVHFNLKWTSFYSLGYKTLAVNLSDVAAMGGEPAYLILSLGIPVDFSTDSIEEFYRGIRALASKAGVALVGGDTSAADRFLVSATLIGHAPCGVIKRSGARVGDDLYVTGTVGDSSLGLEFLKKKKGHPKSNGIGYLISRHNIPTARLKTGAILAREKLAKAMIDISDGLLQDLGHVCKASGVGAVIWSHALPLSQAYRSYAGRKGALFALTGGEDYELLFSLRPKDRARLEAFRKKLGAPVTRIGQCVPSRDGIKVIDEKCKPLSIPVMGYDHFKKNHRLPLP